MFAQLFGILGSISMMLSNWQKSKSKIWKQNIKIQHYNDLTIIYNEWNINLLWSILRVFIINYINTFNYKIKESDR